jgi:hypothetical protein
MDHGMMKDKMHGSFVHENHPMTHESDNKGNAPPVERRAVNPPVTERIAPKGPTPRRY